MLENSRYITLRYLDVSLRSTYTWFPVHKTVVNVVMSGEAMMFITSGVAKIFRLDSIVYFPSKQLSYLI